MLCGLCRIICYPATVFLVAKPCFCHAERRRISYYGSDTSLSFCEILSTRFTRSVWQFYSSVNLYQATPLMTKRCHQYFTIPQALCASSLYTREPNTVLLSYRLREYCDRMERISLWDSLRSFQSEWHSSFTSTPRNHRVAFLFINNTLIPRYIIIIWLFHPQHLNSYSSVQVFFYISCI